MKLRIWKEKLMLILHIRSLNDETLAKKIYEEQRKEGWPGLVKETKNICEALGIEDVNKTKMNKIEYKKTVNDALKKKDEEYQEGVGGDSGLLAGRQTEECRVRDPVAQTESRL